MPIILLVSFKIIKNKQRHYFQLFEWIDKVKSHETKNIVIVGDSFIALELCGWLTTGLGGPDGKQEDMGKKNVSVVMLLKAPLIRTRENYWW
jgi:hypothetical protein